MHEATWAENPDRAAYVQLRTLARNGFKHIGLHPELNLDLEREAVSVLRRAIKNYRVHDPVFRDLFRRPLAGACWARDLAASPVLMRVL